MMKPFSNHLRRLFWLSLSLLLSSCSTFDSDSTTDTAEPTAGLISATPADHSREWFTDYANTDICLASPKPPLQAEPVWLEPETVWQQIRLGFSLQPHYQHQRIDAEFNWYVKHPSYLQRVSERADRYAWYVSQQVESRQLPAELALLPIVESAFDPFAYSHGRASGMWQFIPSTGKHFGLQQNWWYDGRRDIVASTDAALDYLEYLNGLYDGDWLLALAAYNSGQGTVNKAIRRNRRDGKATDFWSLRLPRETRSYVPKLLALAKIFDNPQRYGIDLFPVPNQPYFQIVNTHGQVDLARASEWAGIDIDELYRLNPGFSRWATAPDGPHRLLVPIQQAALLQQKLDQLPAQQRLQWQRVTIKPGDSLLKLADQYHTGVDTIRQVNQLKSNVIRSGQSLLIPVASRDRDHYALSAEQRLNDLQQRRRGGNNSQQMYYTVKSGDSFWTIARRYGVSVSELARWNGMAPKDWLQPGQKLSVWVADNSKAQASPQLRQAVVRKIGYKVRSGDSLARIASRFNLRVDDILRWNQLNPDKYLQPGQALTLYINVAGGQP